MMNYTPEQLDAIIKNTSLINAQAIDALRVIRDEEVTHGEISVKAGLSKFVADKCISAFIAAGLISMHLNGTNRHYSITEDGQNLLKRYEGRN